MSSSTVKIFILKLCSSGYVACEDMGDTFLLGASLVVGVVVALSLAAASESRGQDHKTSRHNHPRPKFFPYPLKYLTLLH